MKRIALAALILATLSTNGCSNGDLCSSGNSIGVADPDTRDALLAELANEGVPYIINKSGAICYAAKNSDIVMLRLREINLVLHPPGSFRSCHIELAQHLIERLDQLGIEFSVRSDDMGCTSVVVKDEFRSTVIAVFEEIMRDEYNVEYESLSEESPTILEN